LSRAHDVLTGECWEGADMSELLGRSAAALYAGEDRRFVMHGPPLRLKPNVALSLSLAVHELCTNAAKYGALSNADGRVELTWRVRPEGRLHIRWAENDGPPVECPSRTGFGTRLIKGALARELDARVDLEFRPAGLVCEIDMPLARASASTR
jgi:two-component sensor histidine kinase